MVRILKHVLVAVVAVALSAATAATAAAQEARVVGVWVAGGCTRTTQTGEKFEGSYVLAFDLNGDCAAVFKKANVENGPLAKGRYRVKGTGLAIEWIDGGEVAYDLAMPDDNTLKLTNAKSALLLRRHEVVDEKLTPVAPTVKPAAAPVPAERPTGKANRLAETTWVADLMTTDGENQAFTRSIEFRKDGTCVVFEFNPNGTRRAYFCGTYRLDGDALTVLDGDGKTWRAGTVKFVNANSFVMHFPNGDRAAYTRN